MKDVTKTAVTFFIFSELSFYLFEKRLALQSVFPDCNRIILKQTEKTT